MLYGAQAVLCLSKVLSKQGVISVICEDLNQFHSSADLCVAVTVMLHDRVWYIWITIKSQVVACSTSSLSRLVAHFSDFQKAY